MEIPSLSRILCYFSNPYFYSTFSFASHSPFPSSSPSKHLYIFSRFYTASESGSASASSLICDSTSQSGLSLCLFKRCNGGAFDLNLGLSPPHYSSCRSFSSSWFEKPQCGTGNLNVSKPNATSEQFWYVINIIWGNQKDLETKLDSLDLSLTNDLVAQILTVLNDRKISAFRFFNWVRVQRCFPFNPDVYFLLIDNLGRLDDYKGMLHVLTECRGKGIDLNQKAFGFLHAQLSNEDSIRISVERVVKLLNKVGGSCRTSGVIALIEMFCSLGSIGMGKFVIKLVEKRVFFYNILVREQCRQKDFEGARCTLNEMRQAGCSPNVGILNYLLSNLLKNEKFDEARNMFKEMLEGDCPPNSLTFEVIIYRLCETGNTESALTFLDMMVSRGLEPRPSTHAAFVKCYFNSGRHEEAYRYAVDSGLKHTRTRNATYSLLATLHVRSGNLVYAHKILSELIDAGLRPNFSVYKRVLEKLEHEGSKDLANDLKGKFSNVSKQCGI